MSYDKQCKGTNQRGERCLRYGKNGYCFAHDPDRAEEREAWRRAARKGYQEHLANLRAEAAGYGGDPWNLPAILRPR